MKIRILGCGSSSGVPVICKGWGKCDPNNEKNRRTRSGILIQKDDKTLLIDAPQELRLQLLKAGTKKIDSVLYTHAHADHILGTEDLRGFTFKSGKPLDIYTDQGTMQTLHRLFSYTFSPYSDDTRWLLHLMPHIIQPFKPFTTNGIEILPIKHPHGPNFSSLGYRIGDFSYNTDLSDITPEAFEALLGVKTLVLDCKGKKKSINNHLTLEKALYWIDKLQVERAYLTHMGYKMDYDTLVKELPSHIRPAYDGMEFEV
ncbi:MAG: MBL fold metallo-hydrolase [Alphaproteobacteria bacterium]|nr:MBL fold metallo-hydrolase [Alphaproteobacteria bacterium]